MADRHLEQAVLVAAIVVMIGLSLWLQVNFLKPKLGQNTPTISHEPDYYMHKFTATGRDTNGIAYVLVGKNLKHFPDNSSTPGSLLEDLRLDQYDQNNLVRTTSSDSGWIYEDGTKILLQGNVQVTQGATDTDVASVTSVDRMTIKLR
jgi:LPS export ABC transporter protein LptC